METALTIPIMLVLLLGFLVLLVRVEAQVELDTATSLAAAAAVAAPAGSDLGARYADETWRGTLHHYSYLEPGALTGCGPVPPGATLSCTGSATLRYGRTPLGTVMPFDLPLRAVASARGSAYRSA